MLIRLFLSVALFSLAGSVSSIAQKISVRTMAMNPAKMPELFFKTEGDEPLTEVPWPARQPSASIVALRDGSLPLYRSESNEDGKETISVAQRVKVPAGASEILLLGWADGDKVRFRAIKDDFLGADFNDWLLINFSSKVIAFKVGEKSRPIKVESGGSELYRISVPKNKGATAVGQASIRGKIRTFYSTFLPVKDGQRSMMLFTDDGEKIRAKRIVDELAPKENPAG